VPLLQHLNRPRRFQHSINQGAAACFGRDASRPPALDDAVEAPLSSSAGPCRLLAGRHRHLRHLLAAQSALISALIASIYEDPMIGSKRMEVLDGSPFLRARCARRGAEATCGSVGRPSTTECCGERVAVDDPLLARRDESHQSVVV
jgi:hypothetical protein